LLFRKNSNLRRKFFNPKKVVEFSFMLSCKKVILFFSYSSGSPFSGQFILPGFPTSNAAAAQQLNLSALSGSGQLSQLSYPPAAVLAEANGTAGQQMKKFRPPLKTVSKSQKYVPRPIPQELGNLKTYSK
jgi:hypothetical protein